MFHCFCSSWWVLTYLLGGVAADTIIKVFPEAKAHRSLKGKVLHTP